MSTKKFELIQSLEMFFICAETMQQMETIQKVINHVKINMR